MSDQTPLEFGSVEPIELDPPGPQEVLVELHASAINPSKPHRFRIPGSHHRAALCADPLARPGMTPRIL